MVPELMLYGGMWILSFLIGQFIGWFISRFLNARFGPKVDQLATAH